MTWWQCHQTSLLSLLFLKSNEGLEKANCRTSAILKSGLCEHVVMNTCEIQRMNHDWMGRSSWLIIPNEIDEVGGNKNESVAIRGQLFSQWFPCCWKLNWLTKNKKLKFLFFWSAYKFPKEMLNVSEYYWNGTGVREWVCENLTITCEHITK